MKLGVMTNGVSEDFEYALSTMKKDGLRYAELQFIWGVEIGDHTEDQNRMIKELLNKYNIEVSVISKHNFMAMPVMTTDVNDEAYKKQIDNLKKCIELAKYFGTRLVRTMTFAKQMTIWGYHGASRWMAGYNKSWDKLLKLFEKPIELAELNDIDLVMETGTNAMVTSGYLARKLIDDFGTKHLKVLWDICNTLYCADKPYPDGYEAIKGYIGHIHIKDAHIKINRATIDFCPLGTGDMAPYLKDIAEALKKDNYNGVISMESVYQPDNGTFEDGYRAQVETFKEIFG
jgi:sugar phosphate isomerase/epimerase